MTSWPTNEFRNAYNAALQPEGSRALGAAGLHAKTAPPIGYSRVRYTEQFEIVGGVRTVSRRTYEPAEDGSPAVIIPDFSREDGSAYVDDLVAVDLSDGRTATRRGIVQCVGERWLDLAWVHQQPVRVYLDGIQWLRAGGEGFFLVDLDSARFVLGDAAAGIEASSDEESKVIYAAMVRSFQVPPIYVAAEARHAA